MVSMRKSDNGRQWVSFVLTAIMLVPMLVLTMPGAKAQLPGGNPPKKGLTTGQKVLLVGGAALLYFMYRKHQANVAAKKAAGAGVASAGNAAMPQLYRSKNGGVYYRDAQHKPVWLTVPSQGMQVSQQELQQYAPDYNRYQGPAPAAPRGYRLQPFNDYDRSAYGNAQIPSGNMNGGGADVPGPGQN